MITYEKYRKVFETPGVPFNGVPTTIQFVVDFDGLKDHDNQGAETYSHKVSWNSILESPNSPKDAGTW
jgi:hypothetical protein